ncbi:MAG: TolC family protein [Planctomycetota bacterium]
MPAVKVIAMPKGEAGEAPTESDPGDVLTFEVLLRSVEEQFPLVLAALEEVQIAAGEQLSAQGNFDLQIGAGADFGLQGFYENERGGVFLEQPTTLGGATFFGGYKLGQGDFPIWEGDRRTNEDGEFSAGVNLPLLRGREIDARRLALWQARINQAQAQPIVIRSRLDATLKAATAYWKWVAAGQKLKIAEGLLALAEDRQQGIDDFVAEGEFAPIVSTDNQRLLADRRAIVFQSERDLQEAAIALSLFWRASDGAPRIPSRAQLPPGLPTPQDPALFVREGDVELALSQRPEVRALELELESIQLDVQKTENDLLPLLDVAVAASQDYGDAVSDPDDKGPFEFDAFVRFDLPLQRRAARGRLQSLAGKEIQTERKLQLTRDTVVAQVRDAESALRQTWLILDQSRINVRLAGAMEEAERIELFEGESNLLLVNIREQDTARAEADLVDVIAEHFRSLAVYRARLGVPYDEVLRVPPPPPQEQ